MIGAPKPPFEAWFSNVPQPAGVLAWGLRLPDRTDRHASFSDAFPEPSLDNAWRCIGDTLQVLKLHRFPSQRMRWVFEHHWLHCAVRPDEAFLAVFTPNQRDRFDEAKLEQVLETFLTLGPG